MRVPGNNPAYAHRYKARFVTCGTYANLSTFLLLIQKNSDNVEQNLNITQRLNASLFLSIKFFGPGFKVQ